MVGQGGGLSGEWSVSGVTSQRSGRSTELSVRWSVRVVVSSGGGGSVFSGGRSEVVGRLEDWPARWSVRGIVNQKGVLSGRE